jgi:hypothetical protein
MKKNVGLIDSIIRIVLANIILYFLYNQSNTVQIIMAVIAAALIFTALNGLCLLYIPFGCSTKKKKDI